jgi:hypothetical protein
MSKGYVNGEKQFDSSVDRMKISEESKESQKKAIENDNLEKRVSNLEEIIFGKEIHEESNK